MYTEPNYLKLVDLIRGADARYVHLEMLFHNYEHAPTDKRVGTYMRCDPKFIADLQWMGFQMMSVASNHSIDFGEGGILKNIENLNKYGMMHAGTGRNLAEARAPAYLETAKGRVAPICCATTLNTPSTKRPSTTCAGSAPRWASCAAPVRTATAS
jgi:poly-gamma-glutamate capsule biosynthesis protein CapA/YwtB (metallophosphatase superfamily)